MQQLQEPGREHVVAVGDARVAAVRGEHELEQVVAADRQEIDQRQQRIELPHQPRHFHHGADPKPAGQRGAALAGAGELDVEQMFGGLELGDLGDHREHDAELAPGGGADHRAKLLAQHARAVEPNPDRAPAHGGVLVDVFAEVGQLLIAADVEGAERDRLAGGLVEDVGVELGLRLDAGKL